MLKVRNPAGSKHFWWKGSGSTECGASGNICVKVTLRCDNCDHSISVWAIRSHTKRVSVQGREEITLRNLIATHANNTVTTDGLGSSVHFVSEILRDVPPDKCNAQQWEVQSVRRGSFSSLKPYRLTARNEVDQLSLSRSGAGN